MLEPRPDSKTAKSVARPYAKAVFDNAKQSGTLESWERDLTQLAEVINAYGEDLLHNPALDAAKTKETMKQVMDKLGTKEPARNLVNLLIDNKRLSYLPHILDEFVEARKKDNGLTDVTITTAFPLTQEQVDKLTASIEKKFNIKAAKPEVIVDKELIGGVRIQAGDLVYDDSIKGKLEALKNHLNKPGP